MIALNWTAEVEWQDEGNWLEDPNGCREWSEVVVKVNGHEVARVAEYAVDDDDIEEAAADLIRGLLNPRPR